jgi:hypothetical protein
VPDTVVVSATKPATHLKRVAVLFIVATSAVCVMARSFALWRSYLNATALTRGLHLGDGLTG